jgi:hypothetical protein
MGCGNSRLASKRSGNMTMAVAGTPEARPSRSRDAGDCEDTQVTATELKFADIAPARRRRSTILTGSRCNHASKLCLLASWPH